MKEHLNKYVSVLIVLVTLILLYIGSIVLKENTTITPLSPVPIQQQSLDNQPIEQPTHRYRYEYVANYTDKGGFTEQNYDGKIIQIDTQSGANAEAVTVIPSVKAAYPKLKEMINLSFQTLSYSNNNNYLYLTTVLMESDGGQRGIIRFEPLTKKLVDLKISEYFTTFTAVASVSSPYIASIQAPGAGSEITKNRSLFLLDLDADTVRTLTTLPANQSFNGCHNELCFSGVINSIKWLSEKEFEAGIYDITKTEQDQDGNTVRKRIETRKFNIAL